MTHTSPPKQFYRGSAAGQSAATYIPADGEPCAVKQLDGSYRLKIGDGVTALAALSYVDSSSSAAGPAGGDLSGTYPNPTVAALAITDAKVAAANKDGVAGTASMRTLGTGAQQAAAGNDSRLSDSRTPTAHASTHASGGSDPVTLAESQVTGLTTDLAAKAAKSANLSDLTNAGTARTNLGVAIGTDVEAHDADLTTIAGLAPSNDDVIQRKTGAWTNRTPAQLKTDLALVKGDVGLGNVDNTSDTTKNAAAAALTNKDLTGAGNTFPTFNQDTTGKAAKTDALNSATTVVNVAAATAPTSGQVLKATGGTAATWQTLAESDITNLVSDLAAKQPLDSDLTTIAGLTATTDNFLVSVASAWASRTPAQVKATLAIAESDVTSLVSDLALKAPLASPALTGTPTAPTAAQGTNTTQVATTAMVHSEAVLLAPLASPTFTGTVTLPTGLTGGLRTDAGVVSARFAAQLTSTQTTNSSGAEVTHWTPANFAAASLVAGQTLFRARIFGNFDNIAGSGLLTGRLKINGTLVATVALIGTSITGSQTVQPWTTDLDVFIDATGSGGSVTVGGDTVVETTAGGGVNPRPLATIATAVNLAAGAQFTWTVQFATGNVGNVVRTARGVIEQVA